MLQKAIENWLTSTNERRYQLPFVQVLIAEGHTIKYVSKHGALEQGKDLISIDEAGIVWAFQLKTGNVNMPEWRVIREEIRELAELSVIHPSIPAGTPFRAVLVTNGRIGDTVRNQIDQINRENVERGRQAAHIETAELDELVGRFLKAQGDFIPTQPIDVSKFLSFYLASGEDFLDKQLYQEFLLGSCLIESAKPGREAIHAVTSAVIMTAYLLKNFQGQKNHFAIFEAWVSLLGYIARFAFEKKIDGALVERIGSMLLNEITNELGEMEEELLARTDDRHFLEGNAFGDGQLVYRARASMVLGTLCCYHEYMRANGAPLPSRGKILDLLLETESKGRLWLWGESAFPFFYWICRFLENAGAAQLARALWVNITIAVVTGGLRDTPLWLPSPYVSSQDVIRKNYGMIPFNEQREIEAKSYGSYVLKTLTQIHARRKNREFLSSLWKKISHIYFHEFIPGELHDIFLWRCKKGTNDSRPPEESQSWAKLAEDAHAEKGVPQLAFDCAENVLPFYMLVAPHRVTPGLVRKFEIGPVDRTTG